MLTLLQQAEVSAAEQKAAFARSIAADCEQSTRFRRLAPKLLEVAATYEQIVIDLTAEVPA